MCVCVFMPVCTPTYAQYFRLMSSSLLVSGDEVQKFMCIKVLYTLSQLVKPPCNLTSSREFSTQLAGLCPSLFRSSSFVHL